MWPDEGWPEQLALRSPESTEAEESPGRGGEEAGGVGWRLEARDGSLQGESGPGKDSEQTTLALGSQLPPAGRAHPKTGCREMARGSQGREAGRAPASLGQEAVLPDGASQGGQGVSSPSLRWVSLGGTVKMQILGEGYRPSKQGRATQYLQVLPGLLRAPLCTKHG